MKVILLKDVRGVGMHGEVKTVADGYAINKLFPTKMAEAATPAKIAQFEKDRAAHAAAAAKEEEQLNNKIKALNGKKVTITSKATEKGGLFKSIGEKEVAKAILAEHSLEIPADLIVIEEPIKTVGEHSVKIESKSQKADLTVEIAGSAI